MAGGWLLPLGKGTGSMGLFASWWSAPAEGEQVAVAYAHLDAEC